MDHGNKVHWNLNQNLNNFILMIALVNAILSQCDEALLVTNQCHNVSHSILGRRYTYNHSPNRRTLPSFDKGSWSIRQCLCGRKISLNKVNGEHHAVPLVSNIPYDEASWEWDLALYVYLKMYAPVPWHMAAGYLISDAQSRLIVSTLLHKDSVSKR